MALEHKPFENRVGRIVQQRRRLAGGYGLTVDSNNLIVPRPQHVTLVFPWRGLCLALLIGLAFKAYLLATFAAPAYADRLAILETGRPVERAGAWVMQPDPASVALARVIRLLQR